jgi:hypothetical protein
MPVGKRELVEVVFGRLDLAVVANLVTEAQEGVEAASIALRASRWSASASTRATVSRASDTAPTLC